MAEVKMTPTVAPEQPPVNWQLYFELAVGQRDRLAQQFHNIQIDHALLATKLQELEAELAALRSVAKAAEAPAAVGTSDASAEIVRLAPELVEPSETA